MLLEMPQVIKTTTLYQVSNIESLEAEAQWLLFFKLLSVKGGLYLKPQKSLSTYLSCHNFFSLSSLQIFLIPACCLLCVL